MPQNVRVAQITNLKYTWGHQEQSFWCLDGGE